MPTEQATSSAANTSSAKAATSAVVLITGASSGIGQACAQYLNARGYRVFGTSRHAMPLAATPCAGQPGVVEMLPMDVNEDASVAAAIEVVLVRAGRLDVVVSNAGFGIAGAVEDTTPAEAKEQLETVLFGAWRVCCNVLPGMRQQGGGTIVLISSIAGLIGIPFQAAYSAAKFALEGLGEALSAEVKPFGIRVVLIEPGDLSTGFTANRRRTEACQQNSAYAECCERALATMETSERKGPEPEIVARLLYRVLKRRKPALRYTVGPASQQLAVLLKKLLPGRLFERILMSSYGLGHSED